MTTAPTQQVRRNTSAASVTSSVSTASTVAGSSVHSGSVTPTPSPRDTRRHRRTSRGNQYTRNQHTRTGRLGSKQQVSVRGRRIATQQTESLGRARQIVIALVIVILGVGAVMWISAATTEQSFQIQQAQQQSDQLDNEIETLQRDVRQAQSSGHIAAEAARMGMVVPEQPGILQTDGESVEEVRGADASKTREVIDVNGEVSSRRATSDPQRTNRVEGLAAEEAVAAEGVAAASPVTQNDVAHNSVLPYSSSNSHGVAVSAPNAPAEPQAPVADPVTQPAPAAVAEAPAN